VALSGKSSGGLKNRQMTQGTALKLPAETPKGKGTFPQQPEGGVGRRATTFRDTWVTVRKTAG